MLLSKVRVDALLLLVTTCFRHIYIILFFFDYNSHIEKESTITLEQKHLLLLVILEQNTDTLLVNLF